MFKTSWLVATAAVLLLVLSRSQPSEGARILGIFPYPSKSHMTVYSTLTRELARRGHELVVASAYPLSKPMNNYTDINLMDVMRPLHEAIFSAEVYDFASFPLHLILQSFWEEGLAVTEAALSHPGLLALLEDSRGFDLVIVEAFINEPLYAFAHHFKAPLVLISSMNGMHWINHAVGTPLSLAHSPNPMLTYSDSMNFWERAENAIVTLIWDIGNTIYYFPRQEALRKKVFGARTPSVQELQFTASLVLLNSHFSLNYPRPLAPAMIEVGGLHVSRDKTSKLSRDLQQFMDEAKDGVIYFSMGSNLRSDQMPAERLKVFLKVFGEIPQKVLWKWESDSLPGQPSNVKLGKWLPQQDILAHPKCRLFITHGGLLSLQEAAYHGVPLVGIPVFGDQALNVRKAEIAGYGVMVELLNATVTSLKWALEKTLHDPRVRQEAKRRSKIFLDQPESPLERAVFWTEYVLRHDGAAHLRSAALDLTWYQVHLLDVTAAFGAVVLAVVCATIAIVKYCCKKVKLVWKKGTVKDKKTK